MHFYEFKNGDENRGQTFKSGSTAYAFALAVKEVAKVKPSHLFAEAIKGLVVYGGEIIRPKEIAIIKFSAGSEN